MKHQYRIAIPLYFYSVCCVAGTPTAGDLLFACDYAGQHGFRNQYGMMCIWYARPCDCHTSKNEDMPRVCLPAGVSDDDLIRQVGEGIRNNPGLICLLVPGWPRR